MRETVSNLTSEKKNDIIVLLISSIVITSFLLFIDEGYYNFKWTTNIEGWIALFIYSMIFLSGQLLFSRLILRKYDGFVKMLISIIAGPLLILILFGILLIAGRILIP